MNQILDYKGQSLDDLKEISLTPRFPSEPELQVLRKLIKPENAGSSIDKIKNLVNKLTDLKITDPNQILDSDTNSCRIITQNLGILLSRICLTKGSSLTSSKITDNFCEAVDALIAAGFDNNTFNKLDKACEGKLSSSVYRLLSVLASQISEESITTESMSVIKLQTSLKSIGADLGAIIVKNF
jgi:hypothetical protein